MNTPDTTQTAGQTAHTPLPWTSGPSGYHMAHDYTQPFNIYQHNTANLIAGCFGDVKGGENVAEANAAFIVLAANNHDKLVEALKELADSGDALMQDGTPEQALRMSDAYRTTRVLLASLQS